MSVLAQPIRPPSDASRQLQSSVGDLRFARKRAEAFRSGLRGMAIGGVIAFVVGSGAQVLNVEGGAATAALLFVVSAVAFAAVAWVRQPPLPRIALEIDRRLGLDERVTTALELSDRLAPSASRLVPRLDARESNRHEPSSPLSSLAEQQITETLTFLTPAAIGATYPLAAPRRIQGLALLGLVLAIVPWVVAWPILIRSYLPPSPVDLAARSEADRLETVARRLESEPSASDQLTRTQVAAQLRKAAGALRQSGGNTQQVTSALQQAEQASLAAGPQSPEDASQTLARIADALSGDSLTQSATRALDNQDPTAAAAAMAQLGSDVSNMTPPQRESLASALQSASSAARGSDSTAADQLKQAAEATQNGDAAGMQQAAQAIQQLGATSTAQRDVARAQSELQASRDAIARASQKNSAQTGASAQSNGNPSGQASDGSQPGDNASTTSSASDPGASTSGQNGPSDGQGPASSSDNQGGGVGKGSAEHLGAPQDLQGLAERQVVVPSNQNGVPGSIGLSNQTQTGVGGTAQVDYANVLPQYRDQALQTIEGNVVPSGLKQVVKGYFDSLAPK